MTASSEPDRPARPRCPRRGTRAGRGAPGRRRTGSTPRSRRSPRTGSSPAGRSRRRPRSRSAAPRSASPRRGRRPRRSGRRTAAGSRSSRRVAARRNESESERRRSKKLGSSAPVLSSRSNEAGSVTFSVESPASARPASGEAAAFWRAISSSTSFSVMKPRFSIAARSMPWRSASSTAFRVALRSVRRRLGCGLLPLGVLLERRELVGALGDVRRPSFRAPPRRLPRRAGRSFRRPAPRSRPSPSSSPRRIRAVPAALPRDLRRATPRGARTRCSRPRASGRSRAPNLASHGFERDDRLDHVVGARQHRVLERARRGDDPVPRRHPLHRPS